ncbi:hypothetical protein [Micromonospora sp. KC606]|uniref:hypothetical protein n=1 Tax=Micromonospora sp. KC606 TaxID=2530379 RepID=UPI001053DEFF|nr:hypothetical protein [Micromonospora sp. KC606]
MRRLVAATMLVAGLLVCIGGPVVSILALFRGAWWTALWGLLAALAGVVVHFSGLAAAFSVAHGPRSPEEKDHDRRLRTFDRAIRAEKRRRRPSPPHADWPTWWRAQIADVRASEMTAPESFITYVLAQRRSAGLQDFDPGLVD